MFESGDKQKPQSDIAKLVLSNALFWLEGEWWHQAQGCKAPYGLSKGETVKLIQNILKGMKQWS